MGYKIKIEYCGREYDIIVFPCQYDEGFWDSVARFGKGNTPPPEEYAAFEKYLEDEGFIEEAMQHWSK